MTARSKRDIAYGCFIVPWAACLVCATVPTDIGTAGFFVLMPLMIGSLAAMPIGIFYSIVFWRDGGLPLLAILTIVMVVVVVTGVYDQLAHSRIANSLGEPYDTLLVVTGVLSLILEASWFLLRRRRV